MAYEEIIAETQGRVGIIRLNRPRKLNAWTAVMSAEIIDQMAAWNDDDGIGAIVLTGEGRAFCAGADVGNFAKRVETNREGQGEQLSRGGYNMTTFIRQSKPTIAGHKRLRCWRGSHHDPAMRRAHRLYRGEFEHPFHQDGLMPELGSTHLLAQLVGLGNAAEMCLTGRMVGAEEALRIGLVTGVTEPEDLLPTALAKADEIANNPTRAVMMIKEAAAQEPDGPRHRSGDGTRGSTRPDSASAAGSHRGRGGVLGEARGSLQPVTGGGMASLDRTGAAASRASG